MAEDVPQIEVPKPSLLVPFEDYNWPMKFPDWKPFAHQIETTKFFLLNKRSYCFSDLGTGKTLAALWASDFLMVNQKIKKVLIVSPLSTVQSVWGREIFDHFRHRKYAVAHGTKQYRVEMIKSNVDFVIINHDGVKIVEDDIIRQKFDLIIIDELTAFKKHTNERSKSMKRIADRAKAVWGMTGAPTPNSPTEAYGQARVVNPDNPHLPRYYSQFEQMVETKLGPFVTIPKPDASKIVNKILQPAIRFKRDECLDIPPVQYNTTIVPLTEQQKEVYDKMKDELLVEFQSGAISAVNAAVKMMKLLQIAAGSVKNDDGHDVHLDSSTRDEEIWRIFEETGKTKLIVFSAFRSSVEHLVRFFQEKKVKVAHIYGSTPHEQRTKAIRDFQESDLQVLVLQPAATAHGITLTAANVIVWHSLVASGEIYVQANGRITRAGQTRKQYIIHLIGTKVEQKLLKILENKGDMSQEVLQMFMDL